MMLPFYAEEQNRAQEDSVPTVRYPETGFRGGVIRSLVRLVKKFW